MGEAITERDSLPVMTTLGVTTLISDSGVTRYRVNTEEWMMYDRKKPSYWAFASRLSARLSARGMALYCPLSLPAEGAILLVGTGLSGGSLRTLLEETACRYGAERLALDLERVMMDFPLPCPSGCGTPLTREELLALREKHPSSVYFSRELMAKYFTYSAGSGTHFVLFDDAETLRQKVRLAQGLGIQTAFLMFPEISDLLPEL